VIRTPDHDVVQFDGPVLELMTDGRTRFDQRLAALGPDILAERFDTDEVLRRLRAADPTRGIGDALLDQRILAGIGNMWKSEGCWVAGIDPWRRVPHVSDDEVRRILDATRPLMQASVERGARGFKRDLRVFEKAGRPCQRCGSLIRQRGQGDDNRTTYWCGGCQS
jgi:endonuclease-8